MKKHILRGFTLVELLVVIGIITVLTGIVLVSMGPAREEAKNSRILTDVGQYTIGIRLAKEKNGEYPNPGLLNSWWCLGFTSTEPCWNNPQYSGSDTLNATLQEVMQSIPKSEHKVDNLYNGIIYSCVAESGGECVDYKMKWYLYGEDRDCSPGVVDTANPDSATTRTKCVYPTP